MHPRKRPLGLAASTLRPGRAQPHWLVAAFLAGLFLLACVRLPRYLRIHPTDNVLVALQDLAAHTVLAFENQTLVLPEAIPAKHKFFLHSMAPGAAVIRLVPKIAKIENGSC